MAECGQQVGMGGIMRVGHLNGTGGGAGGGLGIAAEKMRERPVGMERPAKRIVRAKIDGALEMPDRLLDAPLVSERVPQSAMRNS